MTNPDVLEIGPGCWTVYFDVPAIELAIVVDGERVRAWWVGESGDVLRRVDVGQG